MLFRSTLAELTDLAARLLDLAQEVFTKQLQLLPHASIDVLGADALCERTHEREQQYSRPDDGQRKEKGHPLGGYRLPRRREALSFPLSRDQPFEKIHALAQLTHLLRQVPHFIDLAP